MKVNEKQTGSKIQNSHDIEILANIINRNNYLKKILILVHYEYGISILLPECPHNYIQLKKLFKSYSSEFFEQWFLLQHNTILWAKDL